MQKFSGARMLALMKARNLRAENVAHMTGLSYRQIDKMAHDRATPSHRTLTLVAEALGVTPGDLFADDGKGSALPPPEGSPPPPEMTPDTAAELKALLDVRRSTAPPR